MRIIRSVSQLKNEIEILKGKGLVGLVPTMGALHVGHISLVEMCRAENATCVASLFVNPTQFNDKKDLENYPRTEEADCTLLEAAGCDIVFIPSADEMYPTPDTRQFTFSGLEDVMEGPSRPGHFNGVAQVVSKLFYHVNPDKAYFGEKDFQQLAIIRRMTLDLNLPIEIIGCPIKRSENGLALSSRNNLLSKSDLEKSPYIYSVLKSSLSKIAELAVNEMEKWVINEIEKCPDMKVEYYTISNSTTLKAATSFTEVGGVQGCITVKIGGIRLIDNIKYY